MKKLITFIAIPAILLAMFSSCNRSNQKQSTEVANPNPNDEKTVIIELESNPTTGFSWKCDISNPQIADLISDTYEQDSAPMGITGVGGTQSFVFNCKQTGLTDLTFTYKRPNDDGEVAEVRYAQLLVDEELNGEFKFFE